MNVPFNYYHIPQTIQDVFSKHFPEPKQKTPDPERQRRAEEKRLRRSEKYEKQADQTKNGEIDRYVKLFRCGREGMK